MKSNNYKTKSKKKSYIAILIIYIIGLIGGSLLFTLPFMLFNVPPLTLQGFDFRPLIVYYVLLSICILMLIGYVYTKDDSKDENYRKYKDKEPTDFVYRRKFAPPDW